MIRKLFSKICEVMLEKQLHTYNLLLYSKIVKYTLELHATTVTTIPTVILMTQNMGLHARK